MHGEFKEVILRIDSLHQIEMSQMFTESGSSYKKRGKNDIRAMHIIGFFETNPIPSN